MKNKEISEIVELVLLDKKKNFKQLFDAIWNSVYYISLGIMGNEHDAEDVSQISLIKIYNDIEKLKDSIAFNSWMKQVVIHTCSEEKRRQNRGTKTASFLGISEVESEVESLKNEQFDEIPEEFIDSKENCAVIFSVIQELPEKQKEAILLFYYDEMPMVEIAETLECTVTAVQGRLLNAKKSLRNKLEMLQTASKSRMYSVGAFPVLGAVLKTNAGTVCNGSIYASLAASVGVSGAISVAATTGTSLVVKIAIGVLVTGIIATGAGVGIYHNSQSVNPQATAISTSSSSEVVANQVESTYERKSVQTLDDMVGASDATTLRGWESKSITGDAAFTASDDLHSMIARQQITQEGVYVDPATKDSYIMYQLEKENKQLVLCTFYDANNNVWHTVYVFGNKDSVAVPQTVADVITWYNGH